ncbi:hypothetical protein SPBR_00256 [Sporothrix brasiliensis 5110]|uniref:Zn(2)-C6 fungal-type domain-containing protein n=1 Tax=Sporothrix brasiliensis 5110 TaxID=1398154 RepID=A0A0C2ETK0_9PEZI|nr:uncharacterized protein SPBR_00256 [Sporothrix brasiliensis 5110]KIH89834.1 hypothetical protein SPBR_00256 [Sporothrix brasiliensis 5110]
MASQPLLPRARGGPGANASNSDPRNSNHNNNNNDNDNGNTTTTATDAARRRSRNGCLTCKRRKVRCNEQRPRCYHCQRLRFDCVWKETPGAAMSISQAHSAMPSSLAVQPQTQPRTLPQAQAQSQVQAQSHGETSPSRSDTADGAQPPPGPASGPSGPGTGTGTGTGTGAGTGPGTGSDQSPSSGLFDFAQSIVDGTLDLSSFQDIYFPPVNLNDFSMPMAGVEPHPHDQHQQTQEWLLAPAPTQSPEQTTTHAVANNAAAAAAATGPLEMLPPQLPDVDLTLNLPPILDPIENGPKCASVKALFHRMATASPMFRAALSAFATIQATTTAARVQYKQYYDQAAAALAERLDEGWHGGDRTGTNTSSSTGKHGDMRHILATIFFLTYINMLTGQLDMACDNLEKAHQTLQRAGGVCALGAVEQRIVSWLRLLDARTASAGGPGLLVNDTSGIIYPLTPSTASESAENMDRGGGPSTTETGSMSTNGMSGNSNNNNSSSSSGSSSNTETATAHEVIYEMLCQPGIVFYQEVQTISVRITRIAHAHRSRGSVEDETEVMAIAATILKDLASLYARRPAIMDAAVRASETSGGNSSESLTSLLSPSLSSDIVRAYQTYMASFYACYIHLHRVAHRHLARSQSVLTAMDKIKTMVHAMVADDGERGGGKDGGSEDGGGGGGGQIMVNMLWPLFLWGSEEDDADECRWILKTIRSLHHLVTNANMTANVLQEIQTRQQEAGWRVDIRSVCLELFNTTFAIV